MTPSNYEVFLSGGAPDGHKGVGVIINSKIRGDITNVKFVAIRCRLCVLYYFMAILDGESFARTCLIHSHLH